MDKAELHKKISYVKSGLRILGYILLPCNLVLGALILVVSELGGIAEEVWGA